MGVGLVDVRLGYESDYDNAIWIGSLTIQEIMMSNNDMIFCYAYKVYDILLHL